MNIRSVAGRLCVSTVLVALSFASGAWGQARELQITFDPFDHMNPVWSPDLVPLCDERGDYIAYEYVDEFGRHQLAIQQFRIGGGLTPPILLTDPASGTDNRSPQFSPSGDFVVYVKRPSGSPTHIYRLNVDSSPTAFPPEIPIAVDGSEHRNPRISPDGTLVAYEKKRPFESTWQIWTYCLVCAEETRRSRSSTQDHGSVTWAPNSASLVYTRTKAGPGTPSQLVRYDLIPAADRERERPITRDDGAVNYADPAWTIDDVDAGQYVVAARQVSFVAPWNVVQVDQEGSFAVDLLTGRSDSECSIIDAGWSFRGPVPGAESAKKILVTATRVTNGQTVVLRLLNTLRDAESSCPSMLPLSGVDAINPRWDPNNTNTIYQKKVGEHWQIFIFDAVF